MKLPPGFQLDQDQKAPVKLPPGFQLDGQPEGGYWSDVRKNAAEGIKEIPAGAMNLADTGLKMANATNPMEIGKSMVQMASGTPARDTGVGQGVEAAAGVIRNAPRALFQTAKDVGGLAIMPGQIALGTPPAETMFGKSFRERPLSTTANVATAAIPAMRLFKGGAAVPAAAVEAGSSGSALESVAPKPTMTAPAELPNFLEVKGGQGLNSIAGIREGTIRQLTKPGQNPGTVGTELARTLQKEGAIGKTSTETFAKASKIADQYGKEVHDALVKIRETNRSMGEYADVMDPLHVDANKALKPILDKANQMRGTENYPESRAIGKYLKKAYDRLSDKANANDGTLTLDHVDSELHDIGSLYTKNGANDHIVDPVYHSVSDLRDQMVNDIAENSGRPELASALKKANAGYSRYMRIMPDMGRAAGMESIGQMNLGGLFKDLKSTILSGPTASRLTMKAGEMLKGAEPAAVDATPGVLTKEMAREFLRKANGNKTLARTMAVKAGWDLSKKQ